MAPAASPACGLAGKAPEVRCRWCNEASICGLKGFCVGNLAVSSTLWQLRHWASEGPPFWAWHEAHAAWNATLRLSLSLEATPAKALNTGVCMMLTGRPALFFSTPGAAAWQLAQALALAWAAWSKATTGILSSLTCWPPRYTTLPARGADSAAITAGAAKHSATAHSALAAINRPTQAETRAVLHVVRINSPLGTLIEKTISAAAVQSGNEAHTTKKRVRQQGAAKATGCSPACQSVPAGP